MNNPVLLNLLYEALHSALGVVVETPDPEFLRQKLYAVRKSEVQFTPLAFVIVAPDLWILNKGNSNEQS